MDDSDDERAARRRTQSRAVAGLLLRLDRHRRHHEQSLTLGTADLRLLWLFSDHRPRTLKEAASELGLEQSTINRQVNAAVSAGFLARERHPGEVAHRFVRTGEGRAAFEADLAVSLGAHSAALDALDDDDAEAFLRLLERYADAYGAAAPLDVRGEQPGP